MLLTILLPAVLFIAGLINILFYLPNNKFYAWLKTFFFNNNSSSTNSNASSSSVHEGRINVYNKVELQKVFATFDKNGDGFITKQELKESMRNIRIFMTDKEVDEIMGKVDSNGDGLIDFDEFCWLSESMIGDDQKEDESEDIGDIQNNLKDAFDVFDKDKDGLISVEELGLVLSSLGLNIGRKLEDCKEMIKKVDMDGDGMVNFNEFKTMMKGSGGKLALAT
ncbi:calmodulin-like protein 3 [Quillaja saponaria]|uniref:Calmodulin-like protein 3 n=1 Tax=Quillaja saponaria TaxID=32244 RepID=A0AAD7LEL0_QUISA|nr:calmodulin-like protein 3 [Quillaja saponaria]